jgi:hypothetical protein
LYVEAACVWTTEHVCAYARPLSVASSVNRICLELNSSVFKARSLSFAPAGLDVARSLLPAGPRSRSLRHHTTLIKIFKQLLKSDLKKNKSLSSTSIRKTSDKTPLF